MGVHVGGWVGGREDEGSCEKNLKCENGWNSEGFQKQNSTFYYTYLDN